MHVPILYAPPDVVERSTADGPFPGRAAGLPVYLGSWKESCFEVNGSPLTGGVTISKTHDGSTTPADAAAWRDAGYIVGFEDLAAGGAFDAAAARQAAIHVMTLRGGELFGGVPSQQLGDTPWQWEVNGTPVERFITDTVRYRTDYGAGQLMLLLRHPTIGDRRVLYQPNADVRLTVVHDPVTRTVTSGLIAPATFELHHLSAAAVQFSSKGTFPVSVPKQGAPATPEPTYCPPGQAGPTP
jgi:hypothetical protein